MVAVTHYYNMSMQAGFGFVVVGFDVRVGSALAERQTGSLRCSSLLVVLLGGLIVVTTKVIQRRQSFVETIKEAS
ncbi:hypothetical protein BJY52DRAFT_199213 [Lactarius psammicola]|nr:hypothetical protein BJY52DRAFT_199213 [Lactarius psammicola]